MCITTMHIHQGVNIQNTPSSANKKKRSSAMTKVISSMYVSYSHVTNSDKMLDDIHIGDEKFQHVHMYIDQSSSYQKIPRPKTFERPLSK